MHQHGTDPSGIRISELKEVNRSSISDFLVINSGDAITHKIRLSNFITSLNENGGNYVVTVNDIPGPFVKLTAHDVGTYTKSEIDQLFAQDADYLDLNVINVFNSPEGVGRLEYTPAFGTLRYYPPDLSEYAKKDEFDFASTNLTYDSYPDKGIVESSTGTGATLPLANTTFAGLMSPEDKQSLDDIVSNTATDLVWEAFPNKAFIYSSTGNDAELTLVNTINSGLMSPVDKAKLDSFDPGDIQVNLALDDLTDVVVPAPEIGNTLIYAEQSGIGYWTSGIPEAVGELNDLTDVSAPTPASGNYLYYNGAEWINRTPTSADISDLDIPTILNDLDDVETGTINPGDILAYNGSVWVAAAAPPVDISGSSINQLNDVDISGVQNLDNLYWNATAGEWQVSHKLQDLWDFTALVELV